MKYKYIKIAYMLIAVFTLACFIISNPVNSFAKNFNSNLQDSEYRYFKGAITGGGGSTESFVPDFEMYNTFYAESGKRDYTEQLSIIKYEETYKNTLNFTLESDSEIVLVFSYDCSVDDDNYYSSFSGIDVHGMFCTAISSSEMYAKKNYGKLKKTTTSDGEEQLNWQQNSANSWTSWTNCSTNSNIPNKYVFYLDYKVPVDDGYYWGIMSGKMKVFSSTEAALNYLDSGVIDEDSLAWAGASPRYDGDNIYFDYFQITPHDSNAYSAFYLDFKYQLPEHLRSAGEVQLQIKSNYEYSWSYIADGGRSPGFNTGVDYIDLTANPDGFRLYLDDIGAIRSRTGDFPVLSDFNKRNILGSELLFDTSTLSIAGIGSDLIVRIADSKLYLDCYLLVNGTCGEEDMFDYDFLSKANYLTSYKPDTSGNFSNTSEPKKNGTYFTDVGTDGAGNNNYTYYYYDTDNSKTQISAEDSHNNTLTDNSTNVSGGGGGGSASGDNSNNNVNNPTFNNNVKVTVEGDEINNDVNNVVNNSDNISEKKSKNVIDKLFSFFTLLENNAFLSILGKMFGWLPFEVFEVMTSCIGITSVLLVYKFFHK